MRPETVVYPIRVISPPSLILFRDEIGVWKGGFLGCAGGLPGWEMEGETLSVILIVTMKLKDGQEAQSLNGWFRILGYRTQDLKAAFSRQGGFLSLFLPPMYAHNTIKNHEK